MHATYGCSAEHRPLIMGLVILALVATPLGGWGSERVAKASPSREAGADSGAPILQKIAVRTLPDKSMIEISTSRPAAFQTMSLTDPARFVVDVPEARLPADRPRTLAPEPGPLKSVAVVPFASGQAGVRVIAQLNGPRQCSIRRFVDGCGVLVTVPRQTDVAVARSPVPTAGASRAPARGESARRVQRGQTPVLPALALLRKPPRTSPVLTKPAPAGKDVMIATKPTAQDNGDDRGKKAAPQARDEGDGGRDLAVVKQMRRRTDCPHFELALDATRPLSFEPERLTEPPRYVLRVPAAKLGDDCARRVAGDGALVEDVTVEEDGDGLRVTFMLAEPADCRAFVVSDKPALIAQIRERPTATPTRMAQARDERADEEPQKGVAVTPRLPDEAVINVDFQDADIQEVLGAIARFGGRSIVFSDKVSGAVSLHLTNVTEREAMDLVCGLHHFGYILIGDTTYVVGPPEELQKLPGGRKLLGLEFTYRAQHVRPSEIAGFFGSLPGYEDVQLTPVEAAGLVVFSRIADVEMRQKIDQQLEQIDVEPPAEAQWIELAYMEPDKAAAAVQRMLPDLQVKTPGPDVQGRVIRVEGLPALVAEAQELVSKIDVSPPPVFEDKGEMVVRTVPIDYVSARAAQDFLLMMFPEDDLSIAVNMADEQLARLPGDSMDAGGLRESATLIIRGPEKIVDEAIALVEKLDTPPPQVQISAALTEIAIEENYDEGFVWRMPGLIIGETNTGRNGFKFGSFARGLLNFESVFEALQENTRTKILAKPKLIAVSGRTASILVGQRIPFETSIPGEGTVTRSLNFQDVGLGLTFTPVVASDGEVTLYIAPMVSSFQAFTPAGYPIITTRETSTIARVQSGDMIVIGGLLNDEEIKSMSGVPFLKDVPILGELFKARDYRRTRTELIVFAIVDVLVPHERPETQLPVTQEQAVPAQATG